MVYSEVPRFLPHSIEAEENVLGSVLIDPDCIELIQDQLLPQHFFRDRNRIVYETMLEITKQGRPPDQAIVAEELQKKGEFVSLGGHTFLSSICAVVPTSIHVKYYAEIIEKAKINRDIIEVASRLTEEAYENKYEVAETLTGAERKLLELYPNKNSIGLVPLRGILDDFLISQSERQGLQGSGSPMTGYKELDRMLGGLQKSDMLVIAARPGVGKSGLAVNIAHSVSSQGLNVGIFSLEMANDQIALRLVSEKAGINSMRLRQAIYTQEEEVTLMDSIGSLSELPIYVDDTARISLDDLRSRTRRFHFDKGIDLLIVDYIQLVTTSKRRANRLEEVTEVTAGLKGLAKDLNIPVIALSQLNRSSEMRTEHRPQLSDLRDSGSIEQDADTVLFIYREELYWNEDEWILKYPMTPFPRGVAEIIVAKHRHGALGTVNLQFESQTASFRNLYSDG